MKILGLLVAVLACVMIASQWKDIARYARMRQMSAGQAAAANRSD